MQQTYACQHCKQPFLSVFDVYFHIFTCHMHIDLALDKAESRVQLKPSVIYRMKGVPCPN